MSTRIPLIGRVVAVSTRHPVIVVLVAALLTAVAGAYAASHFTMTANTEELISSKIEWRQRVLDFQAAFPQLDGLTMVVIDGKTPELADRAAARLTDALKSKPSFSRPWSSRKAARSSPQNGLLLLPLAEVHAITESLKSAQPVLASLAADPSLRGVLATLSASLQRRRSTGRRRSPTSSPR